MSNQKAKEIATLKIKIQDQRDYIRCYKDTLVDLDEEPEFTEYMDMQGFMLEQMQTSLTALLTEEH